MGAASSVEKTGNETVVRVVIASDLHQRATLYRALGDAVIEHRADAVVLLGDFLHAIDAEPGMLTVTECAAAIGALQVPRVFAVRGNHEHFQFLEFAGAMPSQATRFTRLHGEAGQIGPLTLIGFPCLLGDDTGFTGTNPPVPPSPETWLPPLMRRIGPAARALWLMHEPPTGTGISEPVGPLSGNEEWTAMIERFAPRLVVCGHDHATPPRVGRWYHQLGQTTVVNVGQSDGEPLHYTVVEAAFHGDAAALPARLTLRAHPWQRELVLGPDGSIRQSGPG